MSEWPSPCPSTAVQTPKKGPNVPMTLHCPRCCTFAMPEESSCYLQAQRLPGPWDVSPQALGSFWNSQASLPLRSKVWSLRPDRPSRLSNLMKGVLVFSRDTRIPCGRALSQPMVHPSEVHTALLSHSCHILGSSLGSTGSKPQVWGRQGRLMKGFFSLHRDSKLSWFLHFY